MSVAHFVFAILTTAYILLAIQLEERDLKTHFGAKYRKYAKYVPMLIPFSKRKFGRGYSMVTHTNPADRLEQSVQEK